MSESTGLCCVAVMPLLVVLIIAVSSIIVAGGIIGLLSDRKSRGNLWKLSILTIVVGVGSLLLYGISRIIPDPPRPTPEPIYRLTDEAVKPFLQAINQSNRLSLGFSPIPSDAQVEIQYYDYNNTTRAYIYIGVQTSWGYYTSWTVHFEKDGDAYRWIGEEETYAGPNRYENIYIHYSTKDGWPYITQRGDKPAKTLVVEYRGEDHRLTKPNLTLGDVGPILEEWEKEWETRELEK